MARLGERDPMIRWSKKHTENQLRIGAIGERPHYSPTRPEGAGGGISPSEGERLALESIGEVRPPSPLPSATDSTSDVARGHKGRVVFRTFEGSHSSFRHYMR